MARNDIVNVVLTGTLVRDPEDIANGKGVRFSIASNEAWRDKDSGEMKEYVNYFDLVTWGGGAEPIRKFCSKGSRVAVTARAKQERWESDEGKRSKVTFHTSNVLFLDKKGEGPSQSSGSAGADDFSGPEPDEDIPF